MREEEGHRVARGPCRPKTALLFFSLNFFFLHLPSLLCNNSLIQFTYTSYSTANSCHNTHKLLSQAWLWIAKLYCRSEQKHFKKISHICCFHKLQNVSCCFSFLFFLAVLWIIKWKICTHIAAHKPQIVYMLTDIQVKESLRRHFNSCYGECVRARARARANNLTLIIFYYFRNPVSAFLADSHI